MSTTRFHLISAIIDVATTEKPRSLAEFLKRPRLPIREMYLTRVIINLVFFARNYLNVVLVFTALCAFLYPEILLVLCSAALIHVAKRKAPAYVGPAKVLQVCVCGFLFFHVGVLQVVALNLVPLVLVGAHAAFTPYTDDAMAHYECVMSRKGFSAPAPRSPTVDYEAVDKMFVPILGNKQQTNAQAVEGAGGSSGGEAMAAAARSPRPAPSAAGAPANHGIPTPLLSSRKEAPSGAMRERRLQKPLVFLPETSAWKPSGASSLPSFVQTIRRDE